MSLLSRIRLVGLVVAVAGLMTVVMGVGVAWGAGAVWSVGSFAVPSDFSAAQNTKCAEAHGSLLQAQEFCDAYVATITDSASGAASETGVTIVDRLPAGLTVQHVSLLWSKLRMVPGHNFAEEPLPFCSQAPGAAGVVVTCAIPAEYFARTIDRPVAPDDFFRLLVFVTVEEPVVPGSLTNSVTAEGGGAPLVRATSTNPVEGVVPGFGLAGFSAPFLDGEGAAETQAGGHPYELPVKLNPATVDREDPEGEVTATSAQDLRDVVLEFPLGLVGSAVAAPTCTLHELGVGGRRAGIGLVGLSAGHDRGVFGKRPGRFHISGQPAL